MVRLEFKDELLELFSDGSLYDRLKSFIVCRPELLIASYVDLKLAVLLPCSCLGREGERERERERKERSISKRDELSPAHMNSMKITQK